jgi:hypothetical protein
MKSTPSSCGLWVPNPFMVPCNFVRKKLNIFENALLVKFIIHQHKVTCNLKNKFDYFSKEIFYQLHNIMSPNFKLPSLSLVVLIQNGYSQISNSFWPINDSNLNFQQSVINLMNCERFKNLFVISIHNLTPEIVLNYTHLRKKIMKHILSWSNF